MFYTGMAERSVEKMVEEVENMFGPDNGKMDGVEGSSAVPSPAGALKQVTSTTDSSVGQNNVGCDLGVTHLQCVAARALTSQVEVTSLTKGTTEMVEPFTIGKLNGSGDTLVGETFHGARVKRGSDTVNQSVTMRLDPSTLSCLSCEQEHPLLTGNGKPLVLMLSDQNFVSMWPVTDLDHCVSVNRLVNPSLTELLELLFEVFDRKNIPDGSVVLIGAVSHLHRVGASCYAREWVNVVGRLSARWPNVRAGPLIPLVTDDCPGGVARELLTLATWQMKVYGESFQGMKDCWQKLIGETLKKAEGHTILKADKFYTIPMPRGLDPQDPDRPCTFHTSSSQPSVLRGLDKGTVDELLCTTATALSRDFRVPVRTGSRPASAHGGPVVHEHVKRVILIGASNLKKVGPHLEEEGYEVVNLCKGGWMVTPETVAELVKQVKNYSPTNNTAIVCDFFGNNCTRATLFDGSTTLPTKGQGGYHLQGEISVCSEDIFNRLIDAILPVLDLIAGNLLVILPPQPRYLFSPCCGDRGHCTNVGTDGHADRILGATSKLRTVLKKRLLGRTAGLHWVTDTCSAVPESVQGNAAEKLQFLKGCSAQNGVHYTREGYVNIAKTISVTIQKLQTGDIGRAKNSGASAVHVSGSGRRFFWRGFSSPVGSSLPVPGKAWNRPGKDRPHWAYSPYSRNWRK
jgi:hypothetical protein